MGPGSGCEPGKSCRCPLLPWLQVSWGPLGLGRCCLWGTKKGKGEAWACSHEGGCACDALIRKTVDWGYFQKLTKHTVDPALEKMLTEGEVQSQRTATVCRAFVGQSSGGSAGRCVALTTSRAGHWAPEVAGGLHGPSGLQGGGTQLLACALRVVSLLKGLGAQGFGWILWPHSRVLCNSARQENTRP